MTNLSPPTAADPGDLAPVVTRDLNFTAPLSDGGCMSQSRLSRVALVALALLVSSCTAPTTSETGIERSTAANSGPEQACAAYRESVRAVVDQPLGEQVRLVGAWLATYDDASHARALDFLATLVDGTAGDGVVRFEDDSQREKFVRAVYGVDPTGPASEPTAAVQQTMSTCELFPGDFDSAGTEASNTLTALEPYLLALADIDPNLPSPDFEIELARISEGTQMIPLAPQLLDGVDSMLESLPPDEERVVWESQSSDLVEAILSVGGLAA